MSTVKPADFPLLLQVFRDGLRVRVIAREEVIAWADGIIMAEEEPDYFFIEVAMSGDTRKLIEVLNEHVVPSASDIPPRVLLGVAYKKLVARQIEIKTAVDVLEMVDDELITLYERSDIWFFADKYFDLRHRKDGGYATELSTDIIAFLARYKDFTLDNYSQWPEINSQVEEALNEEEAKNEIADAAFINTPTKKIIIPCRWLYAFVYLLALASLLIIVTTYKLVGSDVALSKFRSDLYQVAILYFYFFVGYWVLKGIYKMMGWV